MTFSVWGSFGTTTPTRDVFATETFTVLKALTPPPSTLNVTIEVDGGVAKGDGLGGTFYYDPNSVLADDAVDVIAPTPVPTTGRWRRSVANIGFAVTVGGIIFGAAGNTFAQDAGLTWNNTTKALKITNSTLPRLDFDATGSTRKGSLTQQGNSLIFTSDLANLLALDLSTGNVSGIPTFTASTSVVTPVVGTSVASTPLGLQMGGAVRWNIDASANFVPAFDNVESIGTASFRVQNGVFGTSVMSPLYTALGDIVFTTGAPVRTITLSAANNNLGPSSAMDLGTATLRWGTLFASAIDSGTSGAVAIKTNNGTTQVLVTHQGTAVNNVGLQGGATGTGVFVYSTGADTDVALNLQSKAAGNINFLADSGSTIQFQILRTASVNRNITATGAVSPNNPILGATGGGVAIVGTTTNDSAATGQYGEYVSTTIAVAGAVALATGVSVNVTNITLGPGDWDVSGCIAFQFGATTSYTNLVGGASSVTATLGAQETTFDYETPATVPTAGKDMSWVIPSQRFSLNGSTTIFLVAQGTFTISSLKAYGIIRARRIR